MLTRQVLENLSSKYPAVGEPTTVTERVELNGCNTTKEFSDVVQKLIQQRKGQLPVDWEHTGAVYYREMVALFEGNK